MNKHLFDLLPVLLFFLAYKLYDIYVATAVVIVVTVLQIGFLWFKHRKVDMMQWVTLALVVVMGGLTLILHDEQFVKWKLSIIEWIFGSAFLGSQFIGKKTLVERVMMGQLTLPDSLWKKLNLCWALFFISIGLLNVYVMHYYNTDDWVTFKTFIVPALMFVFIAVQMIFLFRHLPDSHTRN